jgi:hypothetical protein
MIKPSTPHKHYHSAKQRFLRGILLNFFQREFTKLFGPLMREKIVDELIKLIASAMPDKKHVKPGQIVWNAIDIHTRSDSPKRRFVPVILTLISEQDCQQLANGTKMSTVAENAIARICREANKQGALLSMRDIGLFTWRRNAAISVKRKSFEEKNDTILPHIGNLHDMGTCISHKAIIVRKAVLEKKDPTKVALETNHTIRAVDRYLKDFKRVQLCYQNNHDIDFISNATAIAKHVVNEYVNIIQQINFSS